MLNRLIKTEKDYDLALSRIDELMNADQGTPEADELELLATLVEMYEEEHFPMDLPDPVEAIRFRMDQKKNDIKNQAEEVLQEFIKIANGQHMVFDTLFRKSPGPREN